MHNSLDDETVLSVEVSQKSLIVCDRCFGNIGSKSLEYMPHPLPNYQAGRYLRSFQFFLLLIDNPESMFSYTSLFISRLIVKLISVA